MPDPEVEQAARFLARHAVLLLGLGLAVAAAALLAVASAVRVLHRHRDSIGAAYSLLLGAARAIPSLDRAIRRTRGMLPSGYLALHLVLGLALTAATTVFVVIAEDVIGGGSMAAFDRAFAAALRDSSTPRWDRVFGAVSWMGQNWVLAVLAGAVAVFLLARRERLLAIGWIAAQAGGGVLNLALKETFERTRPSSADPMLAAASWSFPSGHAMGTFILCGLGCYLLIRQARSWTTAAIAAAAALAWCVVMGFSRLYLGVHFASDVIAGVVAGAAWVAVCASGLEALRRKSAVRTSSRGPGRRRAG